MPHNVPLPMAGCKDSGGLPVTQQSAPDAHITHDPAYETVAPDDFAAMVAVERYPRRSAAFDGIIGQTHDHFWDPHNPAYLDYATPFDLERETVMPLERFPELNCAATEHLDPATKIRLANQIQRWTMSNILHGEQGALSLSASLCDILIDPARRNTPPTRRARRRAMSPPSAATSRRGGARPIPSGRCWASSSPTSSSRPSSTKS